MAEYTNESPWRPVDAETRIEDLTEYLAKLAVHADAMWCLLIGAQNRAILAGDEDFEQQISDVIITYANFIGEM